MPSLVPPVPFGSEFDTEVWKQFFEVVRRQINQPNFHASPTDPGTANVPSGSWAVWKNTTSGVVKLWVNDGGVMKSVTLS